MYFWTLKQKLDEAEDLQLKKYYENWIEYSKTNHPELVAYVNSVLYYIKDTLGKDSINDIKENDDFTKCNRDDYYTYLKTKKEKIEVKLKILF